MDDWTVLLLQSALISTILSIIASAIVAWFTSDRWVEIHRRRKEHSNTLKELSIKTWINKIDEMCPLTTEYDHTYNKVYGKDVWSYEFLPYNDFIESHVKSGYPNLHRMWEHYQHTAENCANVRARILEDIRIEFINQAESIGIKSYYPKQGTSKPAFYIRPYEIAKTILYEKEMRFNGFEDWHAGRLLNQMHQVGNETHPRLYYQNFDLMLAEIDDVNIISKRILELIDEKEYHGRILKWHMLKKFDVIPEKNTFLGKLRQLIEYVELGHNLKGTCDACRKRSHTLVSPSDLKWQKMRDSTEKVYE